MSVNSGFKRMEDQMNGNGIPHPAFVVNGDLKNLLDVEDFNFTQFAGNTQIISALDVNWKLFAPEKK